MTKFTAASVKTLLDNFRDLDKGKAELIRAIWKLDNLDDCYGCVTDITSQYIKYCAKVYNVDLQDFKMWAINRLLDTYGVEFLGYYKPGQKVYTPGNWANRNHWVKPSVYYCNAGDTYNTTIIFIGNRLIVGCWGDLVEKNQIKESL